MPDPQVALPVRVQERPGKFFVVVDADGRALPKAGGGDRERADAVAEQINAAWRQARVERRAKKLEEALAL